MVLKSNKNRMALNYQAKLKFNGLLENASGIYTFVPPYCTIR